MCVLTDNSTSKFEVNQGCGEGLSEDVGSMDAVVKPPWMGLRRSSINPSPHQIVQIENCWTDNTVHIWHESLTERRYLAESYQALLSEGERVRAARFRFPELQERHIIGKVKLRLILAMYLNVEPQALTFAYGDYGKPRIAWPKTDIEFNVSHSGADMAIAITHALPVGIDIEEQRPLTDLQGLLETCLAQEEQDYCLTLPEIEKLAAFYHFWTVKEAWFKAVGIGIGGGLAQCVATIAANNAYQRLPIGYDEPWFYQSIRLSSRLAGAVATPSSKVALMMKNLSHLH